MSERAALPAISFRPSVEKDRPADSTWIARSQVHSCDEGDSYLVLPCVGMDVTIHYAREDAAEELKRLVKLLNERLAEIAEYDS